MEDVFDVERQCMRVEFEVTNQAQTVLGRAEIRLAPQRWTHGEERSFYMKDLEEKGFGSLHVFLSLTMQDGGRIVIFDRVMTDDDYDAELAERWFDDKDIEIDRRK